MILIELYQTNYIRDTNISYNIPGIVLVHNPWSYIE